MSPPLENLSLFTPGPSFDAAPVGEKERQATAALRGYAYQVIAATLAWLDIDEKERLYLEVAEDYATLAGDAIRAVQVKDTAASGSVTLGSENVRDAIVAFVRLADSNSAHTVRLVFLTTSKIGRERSRSMRPNGEAGLIYWRKAAAGAEVGQLRAILESPDFDSSVREFVRTRDATLSVETSCVEFIGNAVSLIFQGSARNSNND